MSARALLVSSLAVTALVTFGRPADACIGQCASPYITEPKSVPSNVSGLPVVGEAKDFTLVDAKGDAVDFTVEQEPNLGALLKPKAALPAGEYGILWSAGCSHTASTHHFTVTQAAPEPKQSGVVTVKSTSRILAAYSVTDYKRGCSDEADVAVVDLDIKADPSLAPYQEVLTWRTTVDGNPWYSSSPVSYESAPYRGYVTMLSHTRVFTYCGENAEASSLSHGLTEGTHEVKVQAIVPGLPEIAPATIQVELSCATAGPKPVSTRTNPDGTTPATTDAAAADSSSSGCSSAGRHGSTMSAWLLALAVGLVAKRKYRRSSAS